MSYSSQNIPMASHLSFKRKSQSLSVTLRPYTTCLAGDYWPPLFPDHARHTSASGPLHWLFLLPGMLFRPIWTQLAPSPSQWSLPWWTYCQPLPTPVPLPTPLLHFIFLCITYYHLIQYPIYLVCLTHQNLNRDFTYFVCCCIPGIERCLIHSK